MRLWIDAQLSPALARWISATFTNIEAMAVREFGLRDATDSSIYFAARQADVTVMTKDSDFVELLARHGAPPKVIWVTCGNTSNAKLRHILITALPQAVALLEIGEELVEIGDEQ